MPQHHIRYSAALASIRLSAESGIMDITKEDYEFLTGDTVWTAVDRSRARRCVEAAVYGALDYMGFPRIQVNAEYVAGVIACYVHPVNILTGCTIMAGCEFTENIINGVEMPLSAGQLFAHVIQVKAGNDEYINLCHDNQVKTLKASGVSVNE